VRAADIPQITELSTPEKILLVEDLWDTIVPDESEVPVPASHKAELGKRLCLRRRAPGKLLSLEELQAKADAIR